MQKHGLLKKLLLSYAAMMIPVAILSFLAITSSKFAESTLERIYLRQILPATETDEIKEDSKDMLIRLTGYLAGLFPATGARNKILEDKKSIDEHWKKYKSQIQMSELTPEQVKLVEEIDQSIQRNIQDFVSKCEKALSSDNKDSAIEILENDWPLIQLKLLKPMEKLSGSQQLSVKDVYEHSKEQSQKILKWGLGAILATLLTTLLSLLMVVRTTRSLLTSMTKIDTLGLHVRSESKDCSSNTQNLSSGITGVAASLEETASSVEELTSIVKGNAQFASEAAKISTENSSKAQLGENKIFGMINTMTEMAESAQQIEAAVQVIDDIAFQINLLALNASVEAARAGEAGKGFAVVAEAVRSLAHKSAASAKEINGLTKTSVDKAIAGKKVANESGEVLRDIVESIKSVSEINNKIAAASDEQLTGLVQISTAVQQIDALSQNNASISESLVTSTNQMADQGKNLQELVADLLVVVKGGSAKKQEPAA
ncbi:methyl-accepting chemotaxis protein [Bdellovibrio sp. HCB337]|uniref:methyl-accepting chemotaxis protein n=1 Tax=Bdellovibrio sp. HCB337 TaxID=3394358 RepID=UPI0039A64FB7